jgi:hypothetical protein
MAIHKQNRWVEKQGEPAVFETDGAREAAVEILSALKQPSGALGGTPSFAAIS